MAEYYRTVFTIDSENQRGLVLLDEVESMLREWTQQRFDDPLENEYSEWKNDNETLRLDGGHNNDAGFFALASKLSSGWTLDFRLATAGEAVVVDVRVRGEKVDGAAAAPNTNMHAGPPQMLSTLIARFDCRLEGEALATEPVQVTLETASSFVHGELFNPDRKLPIVVISPTQVGNHLVNPNFLQSRLLGLARVFAYDNDTEIVVSKELGHLACYRGAIRVFWPGCFPEADSWEHRYWKEDRVQKLGQKIWLELRDPCVSHLSSSTGLGMYWSVAESVRRMERENLTEQLRMERENHARHEQLQDSQEEEQTYIQSLEASEEVQIYQQLLDVSEKENASLRKEIDDKDYRILEIEEQVKQLRDFDFLDPDDEASNENYVRKGIYDALRKQYGIQKNKSTRLEDENRQLRGEVERLKDGGIVNLLETVLEGEQDASSDIEPRYSSVLDSVQHAAENLSGLRFLPSAFDTAESSYTKDFDDKTIEFCATFRVLDDCAKAKSQGPLGQSDTQWLANNGVEYSDESESTKQIPKCIEARVFKDPHTGRDVLMTHHIKMFRNDIRIHLKWESDEDNWLIGYIGAHLPTSSDLH